MRNPAGNQILPPIPPEKRPIARGPNRPFGVAKAESVSHGHQERFHSLLRDQWKLAKTICSTCRYVYKRMGPIPKLGHRNVRADDRSSFRRRPPVQCASITSRPAATKTFLLVSPQCHTIAFMYAIVRMYIVHITIIYCR